MRLRPQPTVGEIWIDEFSDPHSPVLLLEDFRRNALGEGEGDWHGKALYLTTGTIGRFYLAVDSALSSRTRIA